MKALTAVANSHGYSLLWVVPSLDAFFIRNDLIEDGSGNLVFPFSTWSDCVNKIVHPATKDKHRLGMFLDFDEFAKSNGDVVASAKVAYPICTAFLTRAMDFASIRRRGVKRSCKEIYIAARELVRRRV